MSGVVVLGSLNVDHVLRVGRLPVPGQTVLADRYSVVPGGKGRNQAVAVAALGGQVTMAGAVGDDRPGGWLRDDLVRSGVDVSLLETVPGVATGLAAITVDATGENSIVVHPGANGRTGAVVAGQMHCSRFSVLLCSLEVPLAAVSATVAAARAEGITTIVNAAPMVGAGDGRLAAILDHTDVLVVNRSEATELVGSPGASSDPVAAVADWCPPGGPVVVVTLGAGGAALVDTGGTTFFPAFPVAAGAPARTGDAPSTVGAGDTFVGALALAQASGRPLAESVVEAMAAAAAFLSGGLSPARVGELIRAARSPPP